MSQADLANVGKFVLAFCGYFIGTGLFGMIIAKDIAKDNPDDIITAGWVIGGLAFAILVLFV